MSIEIPKSYRLYFHEGCNKAHTTLGKDGLGGCAGQYMRYGKYQEVTFIPKPEKVYVVTDDAYDSMTVEAVTFDEEVAKHLKTKEVGDDYLEFPLTTEPVFKQKLVMVYHHWMHAERNWTETAYDPLLPEGDRKPIYRWREVFREDEDVREIFVLKEGNDEGLECTVSSSPRASTQGQKEGISIYASGTDHERVREDYNKIKKAHLRKWEGE